MTQIDNCRQVDCWKCPADGQPPASPEQNILGIIMWIYVTQVKIGSYNIEAFDDQNNSLMLIEEYPTGKHFGIKDFTFCIFDNDDGISGNADENPEHFIVEGRHKDLDDDADGNYYPSMGDEIVKIHLEHE